MNNLFESYGLAVKAVQDEFKPQFEAAIKAELDLLKEGEIVPMASNSCEFESIPTGEYTDAFNELGKDGMIPKVYNHLACDCDSFAHNEPVSVFCYPVRVLRDVLQSLILHNRSKRMTAEDMNNLKTVLNHLSDESELYKSLEKAISFLEKL